MAEQVSVSRRVLEAALGGADLLRPPNAVGVEKEDPDRASVLAPIVVAVGADRQFRKSVAIEIADGRHRHTEQVDGVESVHAHESLGPDRPIGLEGQNPNGAPTIIVTVRADRDLDATVAIEVAQRGRRDAEAVAVLEGPDEAALEVADGLVARDLCARGRGQKRERGEEETHRRRKRARWSSVKAHPRLRPFGCAQDMPRGRYITRFGSGGGGVVPR